MERHSDVNSVMLDDAKAFDCVWTEGLFYQLYNIGLVVTVIVMTSSSVGSWSTVSSHLLWTAFDSSFNF